MDALKFVRVIGLDSDLPTETDPGEFEVFQGIPLTVTSDSGDTGIDEGELPPVEPGDTTLNDAITELQTFFQSQMQNIEQAPDPTRAITRSQGNRTRGLPIPLPGSGGLPDLFRAIMLFIPGWVTKYAIIADELSPVVRAISDAVAIGRSIREFFIGTDFENAFLEPYAWYDIFKLWPVSKFDQLARIKEAIDGMEGGDMTEVVSAIQDLALQDIEIKFGDNQALRIKAQLLQY